MQTKTNKIANTGRTRSTPLATLTSWSAWA
jgi:hypothetical protein